MASEKPHDGYSMSNIAYDKHGNMQTMKLYGRLEDMNIGLVDDLTMEYTGNQLTRVEDGAADIARAESMAFKNKVSPKGTIEYTYNRNGAMVSDLNKGITAIQYNSLNLPQAIEVASPSVKGRIKYTYSTTGVKLKTVHETDMNVQTATMMAVAPFASETTDIRTTDYVGNKAYENGALKMILVDGGYIEGGTYHFYMTDHLGNNRVVAKADGTQVQKTHYYPFGSSFGVASGTSTQPYKYNGKELDKMHGLNLYDYSARYYESAIGRFTTVDPHAENYYSWSPYAYVGNTPTKYIDPTGMDWVHRVIDGIDEYYYDRDVRSQDDVISKYGKKGGVTHIASGTSFTKYNDDGSISSQFTFFNDGSNSNSYGAVVDANGNLMADDQIIYGKDFTVFGTSDNSANAETLHKNLFPLARTSYTGPNNPKNYTGRDSYQYLPRNWSEYPAYFHDKDYDKLNAVGALDAFTNIATYQADRNLANRSLYHVISNNSNKDRARAAAVYILFNQIANVKSPFYQARKAALKNAYTPAMPYAPF